MSHCIPPSCSNAQIALTAPPARTPSTADPPNNSIQNTHLSLLRLCYHLQEAQQVHALIIKTSQISNASFASRLAEFYAISDNGSLRCAQMVANSMEESNTFAWNVLIRGHLKRKQTHEAIASYNRMLLKSVSPDHYTFTLVLKACSQSWKPEIGRQLHSQIIKRSLQHSTFIRNKLIHFYAVAGSMVDARKLFDMSAELDVVTWNSMLQGYADSRDCESLHQMFDAMPCRDVVSWNTLIAYYVRVGEFGEAIETFRRMQEEGNPSDRVTLVSVLTAVTHLGSLAQGQWVHAYIRKWGVELEENLGSALVNMYSKCGCLDGAIEAFSETKKKNVDTWNAAIGGLATNGQSLGAIDLFSNMVCSNVRPNAITFTCILNACSHGGLVDDGLRYFRRMKIDYGIEPDLAHYGCMVDLFGRAGLFNKVEEIVEFMPMKPDTVVWKALMGACRIHRDFDMGEKAGLQLIQLAPDDHASYVLLSNLYAMANKWDRVQKLRKTMSERGVRKPPGCSSIELDGVVHEFIAGDRSHSRKKEIYGMIDEMRERLKLAGYEPDTEQVLLDIDEEETKETSLGHHSEKLAVAFGIICTRPGTTIRVMKNLRVCSDCHFSLKLLSVIYNRSIIVRDSSRFHHFKEGLCSCMDYW